MSKYLLIFSPFPMLYRSLDKALQKDGYCISGLISAEKTHVEITDEDLSLGYI